MALVYIIQMKVLFLFLLFTVINASLESINKYDIEIQCYNVNKFYCEHLFLHRGFIKNGFDCCSSFIPLQIYSDFYNIYYL